MNITHSESIKKHSNSFLRCINCQSIYSIDEILYRCKDPKCDSLIDVEQNVGKLKETKPEQWKEILGKRTISSPFPYSSGVWGKKEWVLPDIDSKNIVSLGEGNTPLTPMDRLAKEIGIGRLWIKQCGISHTGSFKDLGMTVLVSHVQSLIAKGKPILALACASSGDTSASLASYASYAGIPTIVFLPEGKISTAQLVQPLSCGAIVLSLQTDFDGCMQIVKEITSDQSIYLANSMNPLRLEGQKTMGIETLQQLSWEVPDWFVIPAGNLGNVSALGSGLQLLYDLGCISKLPRICAAQSAHANPLYLSFLKGLKEYSPVKAKKTLASAIQIGNPVSFERAVKTLRSFQGVVEQATEEELANAAARTDLHGMFQDPHTGTAFACLEKLAARGEIGKKDTVVVVSTAHGLKFADSKIAYHEGKLQLKARFQKDYIRLKADVKVIRKTLEKHLS